jgi:hypothetical protein
MLLKGQFSTAAAFLDKNISIGKKEIEYELTCRGVSATRATSITNYLLNIIACRKAGVYDLRISDL